ncbi:MULTISPECIES: hypothetical protein [Bacteroides]|uniref:hypothetical protein n=1 Tax=Bacteroides TaxID=816 RepID=UPI001F23D1CE|nr:hypothetical protein [Bacteroides fragilis]MCE8576853.1 hypothetical protein [Bacteroides fragilis]UHZ84822.1 hypothetical protein K0E66_09295 [Bacteroides fragilis]
MLSDISKRLEAVNTLLGRHQQCNRFMFNDALPLSLFYRDFNDTNTLVKEAGLLFREDAEQLLEFSSSLLSEADKYLSLDRTSLQSVDFETLFEEHLKPFELRYEEAKTAATELWRKYSAKSNRLDFLPLDSEEYKSLDVECSAVKAEYDEAHARVNLLYKEWQQERDRYFCVYCFKPMYLDVLVERLKGIAGSIISDIRRIREGEP